MSAVSLLKEASQEPSFSVTIDAQGNKRNIEQRPVTKEIAADGTKLR